MSAQHPQVDDGIPLAGDVNTVKHLIPLQVFCDGRPLKRCHSYDVLRGWADCYRDPLKLDKYRKRVLSRRYRGVIEVRHGSGAKRQHACDD